MLLREIFNSFSRSKYVALFLLMIIGVVDISKNKEFRDKYRVLVYIMVGTFLILIFYEIKSRYVLHCLIPMILLACEGLKRINSLKLKKCDNYKCCIMR